MCRALLLFLIYAFVAPCLFVGVTQPLFLITIRIVVNKQNCETIIVFRYGAFLIFSMRAAGPDDPTLIDV
jgi:hypothetical protein